LILNPNGKYPENVEMASYFFVGGTKRRTAPNGSTCTGKKIVQWEPFLVES